ncbi:hypothetical protein CC_0664 [Caulobacter vibrioides CB15]|uniref:Uncharacterized protein n=1 Tax=Caulobacter vibrioides (strain ATCC 19089 / CIP 103742 / CB 15) TaxID=190650 RepID=Q9AAD8_CAUVC|nr:hypothetical protein CC_0664 [Caulobacter vibrioides CB15]AVH77056.1 hypothetical protein CA607_20240 [Caulobacter vibrioides]QBQ56931.1 hypothetical protein EUX21_00700 [synthetic Caulobacter sp. 'ethensis']
MECRGKIRAEFGKNTYRKLDLKIKQLWKTYF